MKRRLIAGLLGFVWLLMITSLSQALKFDFSDKKQLNAWEVWRDAGGKWEIMDDALKITPADFPDFRRDFLAIKDINFTDGIIFYRIKWLKGPWYEVGATYRLQGEPDYSNYQIQLSSVERSMQWLYNEKIGDRFRQGPEISRAVTDWGHTPVDKWFHFRIEVKGDFHLVFGGPDGKLDKLIEVKESSLKKGRVGLISYGGILTEVLVDDFEVTGSGIPLFVSPQSKMTMTWADLKNARF